MASAERERPAVVIRRAQDSVRLKSVSEALAGNAARTLWAIGAIYLIGSIVDLVVLWSVNTDAGNPMWEFTALDRTMAGSPRIVLAIALIWTALFINGTRSMIWHRLMATVLIALGFVGGVVAVLMISDYFVLRSAVPPSERSIFASIVVKTVILGALHLVLLVPVGVMGWRRPKD